MRYCGVLWSLVRDAVERLIGNAHEHNVIEGPAFAQKLEARTEAWSRSLLLHETSLMAK